MRLNPNCHPVSSVEKGAATERGDNWDRTPISFAAETGHEEVVKLLLKKGAASESKDSRGQTPLHYAAANGHEGAMKLLENYPTIETSSVGSGAT
jgi:ankyrin repeat protein